MSWQCWIGWSVQIVYPIVWTKTKCITDGEVQTSVPMYQNENRQHNLNKTERARSKERKREKQIDENNLRPNQLIYFDWTQNKRRHEKMLRKYKNIEHFHQLINRKIINCNLFSSIWLKLTLQIRNAFGYPVAVSVRSNHSNIRGRRKRRFNRTITGHGTLMWHLLGSHQKYKKSVGKTDKISKRHPFVEK